MPTEKGKGRATEGSDNASGRQQLHVYEIYWIEFSDENFDKSTGYTTSKLDRDICQFLGMTCHPAQYFGSREKLQKAKGVLIDVANKYFKDCRTRKDMPLPQEVMLRWITPDGVIYERGDENPHTIRTVGLANAMYKKVKEAMDHGKAVADSVRLMRWDDFDEAVQFMENLENTLRKAGISVDKMNDMEVPRPPANSFPAWQEGQQQ